VKEVSADVVSMVEDNLLEGGHLEFLELAESKCLDLDKFPFV
jgi:hypothetical protein